MKFIGRLAIISVFCLSALPLFAAEGVLIVEQTTNGTKVTTSQIQLEKDRMRSESDGDQGQKRVMVFDGPKQTMTTINVDSKTYSEITKADVEAMGNQMADAMAQMQGRMANMPPAQRAQIEAMMRGRMAGAAGAAVPPKPAYVKTGTDKVGKWACDKYEETQNGQKVSEVCTVDPRTLGLTASDLEILNQFVEFFRKMVPGSTDRGFFLGTLEAQGYSGIPIRHVRYSNGKVASTSELTTFTRQNFPASGYAVPEGFQKTAMMGGAAGRGRGRGATQP